MTSIIKTPEIKAVTERRYDRPELNADNKDLSIITKEAWNAQARANNPPRLFKFGGVLVRIVEDGNSATTEILTSRILRYESANAADWKGQTRKIIEPQLPPFPVVEAMLATPFTEIPLPELKGITTCPLFDSDGTICDKHGFNSETQFYYTGKSFSDIPENLTEKEINFAKRHLVQPLADFEFASESDKHNAISLYFTPFIKAICGRLPAYSVEAPVHGSGKGLLSHLLLSPAFQDSIRVTNLPTDENELRKKLFSLLIQNAGAVIWDNIAEPISSPTLAAALTAETYTDRLLGASIVCHVPNNLLQVFTANNPTYSGEMTRRLIKIRLLPSCDMPWLRSRFKIENMKEHIETHRRVKARSIITLIRAWFLAGAPMPAGFKPLGSFEEWSRILTGIMFYHGFDQFLKNQSEFYATADGEGAAWREFVKAWYDEHKSEVVKGSSLFPLAKEIEGLPLSGYNEDGQRRSFGRALQGQKDRIFTIENINETTGEITYLRLKTAVVGTSQGKALWKLQRV